MPSLEDLGLKAQGYTSPAQSLSQGLSLGRIAAVERGGHHLVLSAADPRWVTTSGRAASEPVEPAVGDWVVVRDGATTIRILPRRTTLARRAPGKRGEAQVVAANVDRVFVVTAVGDDFSPRRLERYVALVHESGAEPVVVLNKTDLAFDAVETVRAIDSAAPGVPLALVSAEGGDLNDLLGYLEPRKTVAVVGSSGVGKSTLVNALIGREVQATQGVRAKDDKGRHTTTRRELFVLSPERGMLIDTPGMREVGLTAADDGLTTAFHDVAAMAEGCRYSDCTHTDEPGCAVRAARAAGRLSEERWQSHERLRKEVAFQARRGDPRAYKDTKTRWKAIHKGMRARRKIDPKMQKD